MKITAYKPRPDISENVAERIDIELTDDVILQIGKRYFELTNTVSLPSAKPKKGNWIKHKDGYHRCSECGSRGSAIKAHYCHHCGADMRGEEG